jgi:hypothetical protein
MGAYTALHVGMLRPERCLSVTAAGCGWGSTPDARKREEMKALAAETGKMFADEGIVAAAAKYADAPMRQALKHKDPRGYAEFARSWPSIPRSAALHVQSAAQAADIVGDGRQLKGLVPLCWWWWAMRISCLDGSLS